jgi:hypothetical protein
MSMGRLCVSAEPLSHTPNSLNLMFLQSAPCDFFLFGAMKEAFAGQHFATIADLFMSLEAFLRGPSADLLQTVFQEWIR